MGVQTVTQTYQAETPTCLELLEKAKHADIESVRNAYCVEVVEEDHRATQHTLQKYHLQFLASNETYSSVEQVLQLSCRVPVFVDMFLVWTAGVAPMTFFWMLYALVQRQMSQPAKVHVKVHKTPPPSPEKPPLCPPAPKKTPPKKTKKYIRDLYKAVEPLDKPMKADSIIGNFGKVSPSLRKRLMGDSV